MNNRNFLNYIILFVVYVLLQVIVFRPLNLANTAFCFVYISFVLILPFELDRIWILLIAFLTGLSIDIFEDTLGINAAACVLLAFARPFVMQFFLSSGSSQDDLQGMITVGNVGARVFVLYTLALSTLHHMMYFFTESSSWHLFTGNLSKIFFSVLYTTVVVVITQLLFFSTHKAR